MYELSELYPPKNRTVREGLGPIDIVVVSADREHLFDPNGAVLLGIRRGLNLGVPGEISDISREAAYRYETSEVTLALTRDELYRLIQHDLRPEEYLALRERYGIFFDIHEDFYDHESAQTLPRLAFQEFLAAPRWQG